MADYAIGDLQGCFNEFNALLQRVNFNPSKDHLYLVGDIVARGPDSLACLEYLYKHQNSITVTLGNHDLHLIACYLLNKPPNPNDKLAAVFNSTKLPHYIAFLQTQPLALYLKQYNSFISHAGLTPDWSIAQALQHAQFAQHCYSSPKAHDFFANMYQPHPINNPNELNNYEKFRYTVNYFTRMRFLTADNQLDLSAKGEVTSGNNLTPWFMHPAITTAKQTLIFGHWAALNGKTPHNHLLALDTGCVWGGAMTLIELKNKQKTIEKSQLSSK